MNLRSTCGTVLKISEYGETDKLVTLYCTDLGRITGIAKGARKSKQRFVNKLEEFSHLQIFYRPPKETSGIFLISEAELLSSHLTLRQDYRRYAAASYLCELILRFTRDNDPDPKISALLQWSLSSLNLAHAPQKIVVLSHLHLLAAAGYRPELNQCSHCRQPVGPGQTYILLPGNGSLLCRSCHAPHDRHSSPPLSVQTLRLLARSQTTGLERLNRLQLSPQTVTEAMQALYHYTLHLLQQDIHSWQAVRTLALGRRHQKWPAI